MNNHTQQEIVKAVASRGYLAGWTDDQLAARQLVKELEEVCEALQAISADSLALWMLVDDARRLGHQARSVFDDGHAFDGATVNLCELAQEFPDLVVPVAVLAHAIGVGDMMRAGANKALADVARGVR